MIWSYLTFDNICRALSVVGLIYFVVKKYLLKTAPVPKSALGYVPKELLDRCIALLNKQEKENYGIYHVPEALMDRLKADMSDEETLSGWYYGTRRRRTGRGRSPQIWHLPPSA